MVMAYPSTVTPQAKYKVTPLSKRWVSQFFVPPSFDELNRFGKMCKSIRRALMRNGRIPA